jgi:class 3 adenylate cyclase
LPDAVATAGVPALDSLDIFADVAPALYASARRRDYKDGDVILTSGAEPDRLIVLLRGNVAIRENGTRIATRSPIRLIGEMAFIGSKQRSASVFAEGSVTTFEVPGADVPALMADSSFRWNLALELAWKLREATAERSWRYRTEELLFGAFRSHASPELLQELLETGEDGTPRAAEVVAMFADIRGFTSKVATMSPEDLGRDLGAFLDLAVEVVQQHGGMVDKFIGDEIMAIWGYRSCPSDPTDAVACTKDLVRRAASLTLDGEPLRIGVGLESGLVTLGVVGSEGKRQFTAIGPAVNCAARLQSETKAIGAPICIGPDLAGRLPAETVANLNGPLPREIRGLGVINVWTSAPEDTTP